MIKDRKSVVQRLKERIKPENRIFVKKNLAISDQVFSLLELKGWSQKTFAQKLGKQESEVSKWLSGLHNLTLQSIAKMEAVLEEDIITTPLEACEKYKTIQYITLKVHANTNELESNIFKGEYVYQNNTSGIARPNESLECSNKLYSKTNIEAPSMNKLIA